MVSSVHSSTIHVDLMSLNNASAYPGSTSNSLSVALAFSQTGELTSKSADLAHKETKSGVETAK